MFKNKYISYPYIVWVIGFTVIPLLLILGYGLTSKDGAITLSNVTAITESCNRHALWLSLILSGLSTLICLLLSYPLAYILSKKNKNQNSFIVLIFILPMWMNFLLRTLAWQNILERHGIINQLLSFLHLPMLRIINTPYAMILGMVYNFLPFMVLPIYNSMIKINKDVLWAAMDLGADTFTVFTKIIIPLTLPGVASGIMMVFIPSMTTFVVSDMLGGGKILLIGNVIEQEFKQANNWHMGSGLSLVLLLFIVASMIITAIFDKNKEEVSLW